MSAQKFIDVKMNALVGMFPQIRCRYEFNSIANSHLIEIYPVSLLLNDQQFANEQVAIITEFIEQFPDESILFFTEGDEGLIKISDSDRVQIFKGELFEETTSLLELTKDFAEMSNEHNFAVNIGGLFDKHKGEFPKKLQQAVREHDAISCTDPKCTYHSKPGRALQNLNVDKLVGTSGVAGNIQESKIVLSA